MTSPLPALPPETPIPARCKNCDELVYLVWHNDVARWADRVELEPSAPAAFHTPGCFR